MEAALHGISPLISRTPDVPSRLTLLCPPKANFPSHFLQTRADNGAFMRSQAGKRAGSRNIPKRHASGIHNTRLLFRDLPTVWIKSVIYRKNRLDAAVCRLPS